MTFWCVIFVSSHDFNITGFLTCLPFISFDCMVGLPDIHGHLPSALWVRLCLGILYFPLSHVASGANPDIATASVQFRCTVDQITTTAAFVHSCCQGLQETYVASPSYCSTIFTGLGETIEEGCPWVSVGVLDACFQFTSNILFAGRHVEGKRHEQNHYLLVFLTTKWRFHKVGCPENFASTDCLISQRRADCLVPKRSDAFNSWEKQSEIRMCTCTPSSPVSCGVRYFQGVHPVSFRWKTLQPETAQDKNRNVLTRNMWYTLP